MVRVGPPKRPSQIQFEFGAIVAATDRKYMARKPNYKFERQERERAKAVKKAAKAAKAEDKCAPSDALREEANRLDPLNNGLTPESD